jgi:hypothetical protein
MASPLHKPRRLSTTTTFGKAMPPTSSSEEAILSLIFLRFSLILSHASHPLLSRSARPLLRSARPLLPRSTDVVVVLTFSLGVIYQHTNDKGAIDRTRPNMVADFRDTVKPCSILMYCISEIPFFLLSAQLRLALRFNQLAVIFTSGLSG